MSSNYSSLKFELITTGEQSGSWGTTTNTNLGTAVEQAIAGMATLTSADFTANVCTLTLTNTNAPQNARAMCIVINAGAVSAAGTLNVPAIQKSYLIINNASYAVTVKVTGLTGIVVPAGKRTIVYNNGTDVGSQIDSLGGGLAAGGAVTASNGTITTALSYDTNGLIGTLSNHSLGFMTNGVVNMRLDTAGNLGIGTSLPGLKLDVAGGGNAVRVRTDGSGIGKIQFTDSGVTQDYAYIGTPAANTLAFWTNGSQERMRIDSSGNLGIGTSSPYLGTRLTVQESASSPGGIAIRNRNSTQTWQLSVDAAAVDDKILAFIDPGAGVVRMALDSSGNLGLGVTPSAWSSGYKTFQLPAASIASNGTASVAFAQNAYDSGVGAWKYITNAAAGFYNQFLGQHAWYTAPSGTAGSAITFTQAMTLDASNVLTLNAGALREHQTALAAANFDLNLANFFSKTISGNTTFTVSNVPTTGTAASFILDLTNGGSATITWWSGVKWAYGVSPSLTVSGRDVLGFFTYDGGTTWNGLVLGKDMR